MAEEFQAVTINIKTAPHEALDGIKGGDDSGHYHLTSDEYDLLGYVFDDYRDEIDSGIDFHRLDDNEYNRLTGLLDVLVPDEDADAEEQLAEVLASYTANIIDGGEVK